MSARSRAKHKPGSFLGSLLGIVGFAAAAGLLVSATLTPAVAIASSTANSGLDIFENLPDFAEIDQQQESSTIWGKQDGQNVPIAEFYSQNREIVTLAEAGRWAPLAAISGEDRRFYEHGGVDAPSIARAALGRIAGNDGGASSLTMQLVRQQIVEVACEVVDPETDERFDPELCADQTTDSYGRKLQEMRYAIGLEQRYTKNEILAAYLNIANFGDATYGIQAAAQRYFGINATDLSIAQAASLIAIVQYPSSRNLSPDNPNYPANYSANQERRDYIIGAMFRDGYITGDERDAALATPVNDDFVNIQPNSQGCFAARFESVGFFCDYVQRVLRAPQADGSYVLGGDQAANLDTYNLGGLDVYTTIDVGLNQDVQSTLDTYVPNTETRWQSGGAVTMLEVGTGRILAMAQNKDYDPRDGAPATGTGLNFNASEPYSTSGGFQPGSGYKIFMLAAWIEAGFSVNTSLDTSRHPRQVQTCNGLTSEFDPQNNEGRSISRATVIDTFVNSLNTGGVEMGTRVPVCDVFDVATRMGAAPAGTESYAGVEPYPPWLIGGAGNETPMAMAEAFQTIANNGVHCEPVAIDRIVGRDGQDIAPPAQDCQQAISPEVASVMQFVLQTVTQRNPINNPGLAPVISKTGTSNDVVQTWVNGASSSVAASVWVGNIQGNVGLFSLGGRALWDVRSTVFTQSMQAALSRYPGSAFAPPDSQTLRGNAVALPNVAGQTAEEARATLEGAGFAVVDGNTVEGQQPEGRVEYTSPGAGSQVLPESSVTLSFSDGSGADVEVPDLGGQSVADARAALESAEIGGGLDITWVEARGNERCRILEQDPGSGSEIPRDGSVAVRVGSTEDGEDPGC